MTLPTERKRLKLKNPEKYGWKPRELLSSLARIHANLFKANNEEWAQAVAADTDYYGSDPSIFEHLISILSSLGAPSDIVQSIDQLRIQAAEAVKASAADDENFEDAPEEFEDPLSCRIMKDPVKLPSGQILDRTTILQHLLTDNRDPFSREMMTEDDLEELPDLKNRILQWMDEQRKSK
jgi:ubiquitin conjugation factor E4 B